MNIRLTKNGIKPAVIGRMEQVALDNLVAMTTNSPGDEQSDWDLKVFEEFVTKDDPLWQVASMFSKASLAVAKGFQEWGADITHIRQQVLLAELDHSEYSINAAADYHYDYSLRKTIEQHASYTVRLLCASSLPPQFLDMTSSKNLQGDIEGLELSPSNSTKRGDDFEETKIKKYAMGRGSFFQARCGDIVIFDGLTLHKAFPALTRHDRALLNTDIKMILPTDVLQRIRRGQQPRFALN